MTGATSNVAAPGSPGVRVIPATDGDVVATPTMALSASVAETGTDPASPATTLSAAGHEATGEAGPPLPGVPTTAMSSTPIHSSLPAASVVTTRSWTTGWSSVASGRTADTGVTRVARFGPVDASATNAAGTFVKLPLVPTRYWRATGWMALSALASMSRRSYATVTSTKPVVARLMTRLGASAVPDPARATTGSAMANSVTPPVVNVSGFVWFALTSTTAGSPGASTVWGSVPVLARLSPRKPTTPATPSQLSVEVMSPASAQPWANGNAWGTSVAATGVPTAMVRPAAATANAPSRPLERTERFMLAPAVVVTMARTYARGARLSSDCGERRVARWTTRWDGWHRRAR